jgi:hypothetical protein
MRPLVWTITICRNEDRVLGATLGEWAQYAHRMLVMDTGSIDSTLDVLMACRKKQGHQLDVHLSEPLDVGAAMVARQKLIDLVPKDENNWIVLLDADEVWHGWSAYSLMHTMMNPEIDYIAVRPVSIGQDCASMYGGYYFDKEDLADRAKFTTEHWCDKWSTRAWRSTRLDCVSDPRWGGEVFSVKLDPKRHTLTPDYKPEPMPEGHVSTMFTGRTEWGFNHFCHLTNFTRSSKWAEIPQIPGSNAMDRARWRTRGRNGAFPLPDFFNVPESVRRIAASE